MNLATKLNVEADAVRREYQWLLSSHVATFARILDRANPTSPTARRGLEINMMHNVTSFLAGYSDRLERAVVALVSDALALSKARLSSDKRANLDTLISEELSYVTGDVISVTMRDEARVRKALRDMTLQIYLKTARNRVSFVTALIEARRGRIVQLKFRQMDRSGRHWDTAVYIRTLVRQFLLRTYIETFLYGRVSVGADLAKVTYADPNHENNNLVFSISGETEDRPSYEEIRDDIYHPNSTASVEAA